MWLVFHIQVGSPVFSGVSVTQLFLKQRPEKSKIKYLKKNPVFITQMCLSHCQIGDYQLTSFVGLPACKMLITKLGREFKMEQRSY